MLWNIHQWLSPANIDSWSSEDFLSVSRLSRVSYFQTQLCGGQQSGDYFLYWKLDFTWSSSFSHGGRKYTTRGNSWWQELNCTLSDGFYSCESGQNLRMRNIMLCCEKWNECCVQKTFNSSITYFNKTIKIRQGRLAELVSKDISCHVNIRSRQVLTELIFIKWHQLNMRRGISSTQFET